MAPKMPKFTFFSQNLQKSGKFLAKSTKFPKIDIVKQYAAECGEDVLKNIALNGLKRAKVCLEQRGGHFQHLL